jgi:response regulator RpfG family c-di-GMP phosphodiesterase
MMYFYQERSTKENPMTENPAYETISHYEKIILIDDDRITNILSTRMLSKYGPDLSVEVFEDIDSGLSYVRTLPHPEEYLILLDLNFPEKSGWDFLEAYKQISKACNVVVLTSSIDESDRQKALSYVSVRKFMSKPLNAALILQLQQLQKG